MSRMHACMTRGYGCACELNCPPCSEQLTIAPDPQPPWATVASRHGTNVGTFPVPIPVVTLANVRILLFPALYAPHAHLISSVAHMYVCTMHRDVGACTSSSGEYVPTRSDAPYTLCSFVDFDVCAPCAGIGSVVHRSDMTNLRKCGCAVVLEIEIRQPRATRNRPPSQAAGRTSTVTKARMVEGGSVSVWPSDKCAPGPCPKCAADR